MTLLIPARLTVVQRGFNAIADSGVRKRELRGELATRSGRIEVAANQAQTPPSGNCRSGRVPALPYPTVTTFKITVLKKNYKGNPMSKGFP